MIILDISCEIFQLFCMFLSLSKDSPHRLRFDSRECSSYERDTGPRTIIFKRIPPLHFVNFVSSMIIVRSKIFQATLLSVRKQTVKRLTRQLGKLPVGNTCAETRTRLDFAGE